MLACSGMPEEMLSVYRAAKRGYALVALGAHLSEAERNFHCFNTTWPPERHIELPEVRAAGQPYQAAVCLYLLHN